MCGTKGGIPVWAQMAAALALSSASQPRASNLTETPDQQAARLALARGGGSLTIARNARPGGGAEAGAPNIGGGLTVGT